MLYLWCDFPGKVNRRTGQPDVFDPATIRGYTLAVGGAVAQISRGQTLWTDIDVRRLPIEPIDDDAAIQAQLRPQLADVNWNDVAVVMIDAYHGRVSGWFDALGDGSILKACCFTWPSYGETLLEYLQSYTPASLSPFAIASGPALLKAKMTPAPYADLTAPPATYVGDPQDVLGIAADWGPWTLWTSRAHALMAGWYTLDEFTIVTAPGDYALPAVGPPYGLLFEVEGGVYCVERGVAVANGQIPGTPEIRVILDRPVPLTDTMRIAWPRGVGVWDPFREMAWLELDGNTIRFARSPLTPSVTTTPPPVVTTTPPVILPTTRPPKPPKRHYH